MKGTLQNLSLYLGTGQPWEGRSLHSQQGPRHQGIRNTWLTHKGHLYSVERGSGEERKLWDLLMFLDVGDEGGRTKDVVWLFGLKPLVPNLFRTRDNFPTDWELGEGMVSG